MGRKLYVGNLPFSMSENDLAQLFENAGPVDSARLVVDRETGRAKGFGFVEMASEEDAQRAISELNGAEFGGRSIIVNEARPQEPRNGGGGGGRGFGGGGGGGRGFGGGGGGRRDRF